jgi:endonuclease YncB( thermonuclease family)
MLPVGSIFTANNCTIDRYGRVLAEVVSATGIHVNRQLLSEGLTVYYKAQTGCKSYAVVEMKARADKIGGTYSEFYIF